MRRFAKKLTAAGVAHEYDEFDDDHMDVDYRMDVFLPKLGAGAECLATRLWVRRTSANQCAGEEQRQSRSNKGDFRSRRQHQRKRPSSECKRTDRCKRTEREEKTKIATNRAGFSCCASAVDRDRRADEADHQRYCAHAATPARAGQEDTDHRREEKQSQKEIVDLSRKELELHCLTPQPVAALDHGPASVT
jgi:hypothetical protein